MTARDLTHSATLTDLIKGSRDESQKNFQILNTAGKAAGLLINGKKTKTMVYSGSNKLENNWRQRKAKWRV